MQPVANLTMLDSQPSSLLSAAQILYHLIDRMNNLFIQYISLNNT